MSLDGQTVAVHRVMWTNVHGFIPGKKQIDHKCRQRMCVNPDHLEMVTHKENQRRRDHARTISIAERKPRDSNDCNHHSISSDGFDPGFDDRPDVKLHSRNAKTG